MTGLSPAAAAAAAGAAAFRQYAESAAAVEATEAEFRREAGATPADVVHGSTAGWSDLTTDEQRHVVGLTADPTDQVIGDRVVGGGLLGPGVTVLGVDKAALTDAFRDIATRERGLSYRDVLLILTEELRRADTDALDAPVLVEMGDTVDGIRSIRFDPDRGRLVVMPWLTRGVPRAELPDPGIHDFLCRETSDVGAALLVLRQRSGLSRAAAAQRAGLGYTTVGNCEGGRDRPSPDALLRLVAVYGGRVEVRDVHSARPENGRADFTVTQPSQLGPIVRALRLRRGMSLADLSTAAYATVRMVAHWEDGVVQPTVSTAVRLIGAVGGVLAIADLDRREA